MANLDYFTFDTATKPKRSRKTLLSMTKMGKKEKSDPVISMFHQQTTDKTRIILMMIIIYSFTAPLWPDISRK